MKGSQKRIVAWILIAAAIFTLFRWLFGMGIPDASNEFAAGITIILVSGLLSGRYVSRFWYNLPFSRQVRIIELLFFLIITGCILIGYFVNQMIDETEFNYFFFSVLSLFLMAGFVSVIISLLRNRIKVNLAVAYQQLAQSKAELQNIQAQLSPHFLFNTLNNLYGLSITYPQKLPPLLLKLSDLLRYSVYEVKDPFVTLKEEILYLNNYIEFEKIRLGDRLQLKTDFQSVVDDNIRIAPLLLIVFVENAFKHSKNNEDDYVYIEIRLQASRRTISFSITNSFKETPATGITQISKHSGFGLASVKKRLNIIYAGHYNLTFENSNNIYSVNLELRLT